MTALPSDDMVGKVFVPVKDVAAFKQQLQVASRVQPKPTSESVVRNLAQDPNDPSRLYMAASDQGCSNCPDGGVYVSTDSGLSWTPVLTPTSAIGNVKIAGAYRHSTALNLSIKRFLHDASPGCDGDSAAGINRQADSPDLVHVAADAVEAKEHSVP